MLKILRKKGVAKKILWVVAIIIIISFGFLGTAYLLTDQRQVTHAGSIFGKKVPFTEFDRAYRDVRIQALIRHGDQFNDYIRLRNLEADTWDRLILLHEAKRRRLKASDEEIIHTLQQYPFFHRDGRFDNFLYRDIVRYIFNIQPRDFEETTRESLRINKLFAQETFAVTVTEEEIRRAFERQNEKIQISYVFISPEQFKNEALYDEARARTYYEENISEFTVPRSINVDYLHLPFPLPMGEENEEERGLKEKETRELAEKIYQELSEAPDLKAVAEAHGFEVKTSGFFSMEEPRFDLGMSFDLLKRLFELPAGQISQPFETPNGYFIVKIVEKRQSYTPDYEEAKEKIKDAVLINAALVIAYDRAAGILKEIEAKYEATLPHDFVNAARVLGLELGQTPLFNRGQYLPRIGISREFQEAAFSLTKEKRISGVVATPAGFYILHLDEHIPADQNDYETQKDNIAQILLLEKRGDVFDGFLSRLRLEANLIDNISPLRQQPTLNQ